MTEEGFEIRGEWLHANGARYNLRAVTYYVSAGDSVLIAIQALQYLQTVSVPDAPGEPFGAGGSRLCKALDEFFGSST